MKKPTMKKKIYLNITINKGETIVEYPLLEAIQWFAKALSSYPVKDNHYSFALSYEY
tara:strand:- start:234 stop:404 length:171 start_codon:yes stop_codon:yes gene_type:complete